MVDEEIWEYMLKTLREINMKIDEVVQGTKEDNWEKDIKKMTESIQNLVISVKGKNDCSLDEINFKVEKLSTKLSEIYKTI